MSEVASSIEGEVRNMRHPFIALPKVAPQSVKPLRVLHVHSGNLFGGVETLMLTLTRHQHFSPDVKHHFALCFAGRLGEELAATGTPLYSLGKVRVSRPLSIWRARRRLKDLLSEHDFDLAVCHSAWSQSIFGPVIRSTRLPLIFWLHQMPDGLPWPERWARSIRPDLVICNSKYTADRLPRLYSPIPSEVVYCPVAPSRITYSRADLEALREELDTPKDAVVVTQGSRMEEWKGYGIHLDALGLLGDTPEWICWLAGGAQRPSEENYLRELKESAARLGIASRIRFLGQRSDVTKLLAAADIYCQPNLQPEPFGIAFVEALYAQKPVVATSLGGAREIVDPACGFLVPPNDARSVATALRLLIADGPLRQKLGKAGPARAKGLGGGASEMRRGGAGFVVG